MLTLAAMQVVFVCSEKISYSSLVEASKMTAELRLRSLDYV